VARGVPLTPVFLLRSPTASDVRRFLEDCRERPLSYDGTRRRGFLVDRETFTIGRGRPCFVRAVRAVQTWAHFELGWVSLSSPEPIVRVGAVAAVRIRHMGFWSLNGCRVSAMSGSEHEASFRFTYRTLTNHAECGEEAFVVALDPRSHAVFYSIEARSRPRAALTILGFPYVRVLQARFRRDSAAVLRRLVGAAIDQE
jgi:uncharacterized protein (UPF0548 family)